MFSVPGWNVSAPLATQVEETKPHKLSREGKRAKKRREKREAEVNGDNVNEQWERVVEGKDSKRMDKNGTHTNGNERAADQDQEKRGKKRKRKSDKADEKDIHARREARVTERHTGPKAGADAAAQGALDVSEREHERKKHKKDRKKERPTQGIHAVVNNTTSQHPVPAPADLLPPEPKGLTPLQKSMREKLTGARFRHLNETLYTKPSSEALGLFKDDPSMFEDYHRGFSQQVEVWPENPVDGYVDLIIKRSSVPKSKDPRKIRIHKDTKSLPRDIKGVCTIADLGCGTASLAYRLQSHLNKFKLKIHSFDLSKPSGPSADLVTVADISAVPLADNSVDVAILCLALMGINWLDFIDEAYRILHRGGELWIAEIKSRFARTTPNKNPPPNSVGSLKKKSSAKQAKRQNKNTLNVADEDIHSPSSADEAELAQRVDGVEPPSTKGSTDVTPFVDVLRKHGFLLDAKPHRANEAVDLSNKMFVKMHFIKAGVPVRGKHLDVRPQGGLKQGVKGRAYAEINTDRDRDEEDVDAGVLKPCLYKVR